MATKAETLLQAARGEGCLGRAADDEPVFVLRAKDPVAAVVVRIWCQLAHQMARHEPAKIEGAAADAATMEGWREARFGPYRWSND